VMRIEPTDIHIAIRLSSIAPVLSRRRGTHSAALRR
jgi:hypothetical protein